MSTSPIQASIAQAINSANQLNGTNGTSNSQGAQFGQMLTKMLEKTSKSQEVSADLSSRLQLDDPNVSVEQSVLASNEASLNFEFTLQTRNKLFKAYQELMNMPV